MLFQSVDMQRGFDPACYANILPGQKGGVVKTAGIVKGAGTIQPGADGELVAWQQVFWPVGLEFQLYQTACGVKISAIFETQGLGLNQQAAVLAIKSRHLCQGTEQNCLLFLLNQLKDMIRRWRFSAGKGTMNKAETGDKRQEQKERCLVMSSQVTEQGTATCEQGQEENPALHDVDLQGEADTKGEKESDNQQEVGGKGIKYPAHSIAWISCRWRSMTPCWFSTHLRAARPASFRSRTSDSHVSAA